MTQKKKKNAGRLRRSKKRTINRCRKHLLLQKEEEERDTGKAVSRQGAKMSAFKTLTVANFGEKKKTRSNVKERQDKSE